LADIFAGYSRRNKARKGRLKSGPGLDPIRGDERFKAMIAAAKWRLAASND
jgi:hypothetical protein